MFKLTSVIFFLMICRPLEALCVQDTSAQSIISADSLMKVIEVLDSIMVDSSDTTAIQQKTQQSQTKVDSLGTQDTTAAAPSSFGASQPDSAPKLSSIPQSTVADSLEKAATEPKPRESEAKVDLLQPQDTTIAEPPALGISQPDSASRPEGGTEQQLGVSEPQPQALPQSLSEEARSAEEIILRQIESVTKIFSLSRIILTLIVFASTFFAVKIITVLLTRIAGRRARLAPKLRNVIPVVNFGLWFFAVYLVIVGIFARSPLLIVIVVAVLTLAAGFASRQLLQDLVGGIVIMIERPFQIGDRIRIGGHYGEVARIGLRAFHLISADGAVVVIPNAEVMRQSIANANPGTMESQVTTELLLPAEFDIEEAKKIAFEAAAVSPYVYIRKPIEVLVAEEYDGELFVKIVVKAYVFDVRYERELRSSIIEQVRKAFSSRD
jgi:small-conductance mechanosensitive channel